MCDAVDAKEYRVRNAIKRYLNDIYVKHRLFKKKLITYSDNQYSYYNSMMVEISKYLKTHILLYNYIHNKLSIQHIALYIGYSIRHTQRYLQKQVQMFVDFVTCKEDEALAKYPFVDKLQINDEIKYEEN